MNSIVPRTELCSVVEPYCRKAGNGHPPLGLERMLWIHFLAQAKPYALLKSHRYTVALSVE